MHPVWVLEWALVLGWAAFVYFLLRSLRYLMAARLFMTCAVREVEANPVARQHLDPGELPLLTLLDADLSAAGFRPLGFGAVSPSMTYFSGPLVTAVFVNERIPAYAFVHRHLAPEFGKLVELEVRTALACGEEIITGDTPFSTAYIPPGMHVESLAGQAVREVVARHAERVDAARASGSISEHHSLEDALSLVARQMAKSRSQFRQRKWAAPTTDLRLDRFTLRGAVALTLEGYRSVTSKRAAVAHSSRAPVVAGPLVSPALTAAPALARPISDYDRALRIEADLLAVLQVAQLPEAAPGTPWPLLAVITATAVFSLIAMAALWNWPIAALILAIVAFHEAGHAIAMRMFGYRDVHVFFVPLLGAMTVGRPAVTNVRDRLCVLLAGPVPGLWLAVVLLGIEAPDEWQWLIHEPALALLLLNGLNLLPFTPLDGGRVLEALSKPESVWRLVVQGVSAAGLLVLAAYVRDPIVAVLGVFWAATVPQYLASYRLRRAVAAAVTDRTDFRAVARTALEVMMATPRYAASRAVTRQATARAIARLFAESPATAAERRWGVIAYSSAWIPVVIALILWMK
jgi:Zn-dependent protease